MKKTFALTALLLLLLEPFFGLISFVKIENIPLYTSESQPILLSFAEKSSQTALNENKFFGTKPSYIATGSLQFKSPQQTLWFSLDRESLQNGVTLSVIYQNKRIPVVFEEDGGDERMLLEKTIPSNPIFFDDITSIAYEVTSLYTPTTPVQLSINGISQQGYEQKIMWQPSLLQAEADGEQKIISRSEWLANEEYRYEDSPVWVNILQAEAQKTKTAWDIAQEEKIKKIREHLNAKFAEDNVPVETIGNQNNRPLAWSIKKTKFVKKIVVHHTADTYKSSKSDAEIMRNTYYYHAITNGWGDIGYNYVIGHDGEIFEGRAWGDYAVGAHALWNNESSVGISVMGNYETEKLNEAQQKSLLTLISTLSKKYGINVSAQTDGHKDCKSGDASCVLIDFKTLGLVGHRDVGYTACPGKNLYPLIEPVREGALTTSYTYVAYEPKNNPTIPTTPKPQLAKGPTVRIRLSYPVAQKTIKIRSQNTTRMKINIGNKNGTLPKNAEMELSTYKNNQILLQYGKKKYILPNIRLSAPILEVPSWSRVPAWDTSKTHNDNLFRGTLEIDSESGSLVVINELPLEDYLKGLAEISNGDNTQKIKTILVAARSYAYFYSLKENRKFPGKSYDGSDNPDEFQKYLGYGYEKRSPLVSNLVDETNGTVVTYNEKPIKPWYFNQSDGQTRSYKQYCEARVKEGSLPKTTICEDIPYLQTQSDPGCVGKTRFGHGVGISGAGATYLATTLDFTHEQIIEYYLAGTKLKKIY